jgi:hypothetical protein
VVVSLLVVLPQALKRAMAARPVILIAKRFMYFIFFHFSPEIGCKLASRMNAI